MQNFKGDALELQMQEVTNSVFDKTNTALDQFYEEGFQTNPFLLMLYDESRMPFSDRINREAFIPFIKEALANFPFIGTFESYLFILISIFGSRSRIEFTVDTPGTLGIKINAVVDIDFDFIAREFVAGSYQYHNVVEYDGNNLSFRGISGIETEYELELLFAEIMPCGITPDLSLFFFSEYEFLDDEGVDEYTVTDEDDDIIIFTEGGG